MRKPRKRQYRNPWNEQATPGKESKPQNGTRVLASKPAIRSQVSAIKPERVAEALDAGARVSAVVRGKSKRARADLLTYSDNQLRLKYQADKLIREGTE